MAGRGWHEQQCCWQGGGMEWVRSTESLLRAAEEERASERRRELEWRCSNER